MVENHYRWDFIGLSTDDKPTPATSEKVADGSTFYCSDNSKLYVFYKDQWYEKEATGGGGGGQGVTELTSANYNFHYSGDTDDSIAPWLLDDGIYLISGTTDAPVKFCREFSNQFDNIDGKAFLTVTSNSSANVLIKEWMIVLINTSSTGSSRPSVAAAYKNSNNVWNKLNLQRGSNAYNSDILLANDIQNNLTSNGAAAAKQVLSAYQGAMLKELIDKKIPTFYTTNAISEGFTDAPLYSTRSLASQIDGSKFYNALANGGFVLCQIVNNDVDIAYTVAGYTIPYENSTTGFDHYPPTAYITNGTTTMELSFTSAIPTSQGHFTCSEM